MTDLCTENSSGAEKSGASQGNNVVTKKKMSQQSSVINGPTTDNKEDIFKQDNVLKAHHQPNDQQPYFAQTYPQPSSLQNTPNQPPPSSPRPGLARVDSRTNFPYRPPPFPNQQLSGAPQIRPQNLRPQNPQQFLQRSPTPVWQQQKPLAPPGTQGYLPQQSQQVRPQNFRPLSPYPPRQPLQGSPRPQIQQQRSVPAYTVTRPPFIEEGLQRSQTLDTAEIEHQKNAEEIRNSPMENGRPPSVNRSFSVTNSNTSEHKMDNQKRSGSLDFSENVEIKPLDVTMDISSRPESKADVPSRPESRGDAPSRPESRDVPSRPESRGDVPSRPESRDVPSRPESRAASRMNKIIEDEPISLITSDVSPSHFVPENVPQNIQQENIRPKVHEENIPPKAQQENIPQKIQQSDVVKELVKTEKQKQFLDLDKSSKKVVNRSPARSAEGDNDSGVDESTQGNDQLSNGDAKTPRKITKSRNSTNTPTQGRSASRSSKTPSIQSPDSTATTPGAVEKKKLPMNKVQVGSAPSPNLKVVRSKIGSLENTSYKPGGGKIKIENKKIDFKSVTPRIEAKNDKYVPKGGEKKITQQKLQWNAKSKIGSLDNSTYKPKGGDKKIETVKLDFKDKAKPKVGSKDNIKHQPGGGEVKIETKKIELHASSKVGSLDNVKHRPSGGDKKIFDDKDYLRQKSGKSSMNHSLSGSQNSLPSQTDGKAGIADENLNQEH